MTAPLPLLAGTAPVPNLVLDSDIRDWVVLPLLVIMISAGLLRHFLGTVLKGAPKKLPRIEQRTKMLLRKSTMLRSGSSNFLSKRKWEARRTYMSDKEDGYLREEADWAIEEKDQAPPDAAADPMNPMAMMDGMKGQMVFMVQNMVMMNGISHFFKGFILLKVPFPLTRGFKLMFQRGLDLQTLDTSYVSSVSWYFLVMFGLRSFFRMAIGDATQEEQEDSARQFQLGLHMAAGPQQYDPPKELRVEADNLEMISKKTSELDSVEKRLLGKKYPKKKMQAKDDLYGYGLASANSTTSAGKRSKKSN
jgi:hypothetical protein